MLQHAMKYHAVPCLSCFTLPSKYHAIPFIPCCTILFHAIDTLAKAQLCPRRAENGKMCLWQWQHFMWHTILHQVPHQVPYHTSSTPGHTDGIPCLQFHTIPRFPASGNILCDTQPWVATHTHSLFSSIFFLEYLPTQIGRVTNCYWKHTLLHTCHKCHIAKSWPGLL